MRACTMTARFKAGLLSPVDTARESLSLIKTQDAAFHAVCHINEKDTMMMAAASARRWRAKKPLGPIDGVPVTVKDWFHVKDWPTRMGSLTSSTAPQKEDSPVIALLRAAGAVIIAKTTLPEFGHKGVTDSPLYGITRNPWDTDKTSGGSSGGAAVAAAAGYAPLNLGSDAGGSVRIPASFCGVVGFKPSPGIIPTWPPSLFSTLSSAGPLTSCVADAALMMDVLAKPLGRDINAAPFVDISFFKMLTKPLPRLRIALATSINGISATPDVKKTVLTCKKHLQKIGKVDVITLDAPALVDTFNKHWMAVASLMAEGLTPTQRKKCDPRFLHWAKRGDKLHLHDYLRAEHERMMTGSYFCDLLSRYDLIVTPTTAMTAFDAGQNMPRRNGKPWDDWTPFTYIANLARLPAISIPCGFDGQGMPVGLQIMGKYLDDARVLQAAHRMEELISFNA